jgi:nucleoside diphosphate kinase
MEYEKNMAESVMRPGIGLEIANFFQSKGFKVSKIQEEKLAPMTYEQFFSDLRDDFIFAR